MDFFSQQEKAKRYTKFLLLYFIIAVIFIVTAVNVVMYLFFIFIEAYPYTPQEWYFDGVVYYVSAATLALIFFGSLYRWKQLKSGGHAVAAMVGAQRLDLHTSDVKKRRFINVVEEMSIASGVPLPSLYVMEEESGINAFVAGYMPTQAVMVITEGALEQLNRDELQGVVAHEYSHILNGDMRINIRLISVLAGIVLISEIGRVLMRGNRRGRRRYVSTRSSSKNSGGAVIVLGLMLFVVGFIGVMFGRLIKAAVSRQREVLADAAAVQFTRNPKGIAAALYKIRQAQFGSILENSHAEEMSHMCFSSVNKSGFMAKVSQFFATHPPLDERIKKIDPTYISLMKAKGIVSRRETENIPVSEGDERISALSSSPSAPMAPSAVATSAGDFVETAGQIDQSHIEYAAVIHQSFSDALMESVHQAESAKVICLLMILVKMEFKQGFVFIEPHLGTESVALLKKHKDEIKSLQNNQRLPLFDMLLPSLKVMQEVEREEFVNLCRQLVKLDKRYTMFEFVLIALLEKQLLLGDTADSVKYYSYKPLHQSLQTLFSVMAYCSGNKQEECASAYQSVSSAYSMSNSQLINVKDIKPAKLGEALTEIALLSPMLKKNVIESSADLVMHDNQFKVAEAELLRVVCEILDCPVPPLLPQATN